jgi:hypothetical protein
VPAQQCLQARAHWVHAGAGIDVHRLSDVRKRTWAKIFEPEKTLGLSPDGLTYTDGALLGKLLEAVGQIAREALGVVVYVPPAADGADDHGTSVEAHTQRQGDPLRALHVFGEGGERPLDL